MSEEKKDQVAVEPTLEAEKTGMAEEAVQEDQTGKSEKTVKEERTEKAEETVKAEKNDQAETDAQVKETEQNESAGTRGKVEKPPAAQEEPASDSEGAAEALKAEPAKEAASPAAENAPPAVEAGERAEAAAKPASEPDAAEPAALADKAKRAPLSEEEKAARLKAAEERRAAKAKAAAEGGADAAGAAGERPARAAAAAAGDKPERPARAPRAKASEEPPKPKEPSPKQPVLDALVDLLKAEVAEDAVEAAVINEENGHLPTITVKNEHWLACASLLRHHPEWSCNYLRNLAGADHETHLEVVYYFINLSTKAEAAVHVKTDREQPSIASVTPIWPTANWCEREVYDLLGIDFPGHPDLRRIMMPDDWVGHPLRKDYEPLDSEV